ncbi:BatA domain-containing protein [Thalassotalea sp. SU-HH00458]|uniref:BatA domain-containing protein n=1 Tax=Thalassotalea sp. SU-HH00458 TaxID=3127657 RepID=UPI0031068977
MLSWSTSFPSYLWAFVALAVPVLIHLLSKSKGKPVSVGTLKFFQQVKPVKMTQIKLVDALLLMLRLSMLICAILLVSQLWLSDSNKNDKPNIALISPNWLDQSTLIDKQALLRHLDNQPAFLLDSKLTELNKQQVLTWQKREMLSENSTLTKSLWQAINTAHFILPKQATFHIYTDNQAINFIGEPVKIAQQIQWHVLENKPNVEKSLINSRFNVVIVRDQDRLISQRRLEQAFMIIKQVLLPELSITILENQELFNLETGSDFVENTLMNADWLFYLTSNEPPLSVKKAIQRGINVFIDSRSNGNIDETTTSLLSYDVRFEDVLLHKRVKCNEQTSLQTWFKLNQKAKLNNQTNNIKNKEIDAHYQTEALWFTEQGQIVLEKHTLVNPMIPNTKAAQMTKSQQDSQGSIIAEQEKSLTLPEKNSVIYQFYSRLEPGWSEIAEQPQFIQVLLNLLMNTDDSLQSIVNKRLSLTQIESLDTKIASELASNDKTLINKSLKLKDFNQQPLTQWLILLLIISWCLERLLSEYGLKKQVRLTKRGLTE